MFAKLVFWSFSVNEKTLVFYEEGPLAFNFRWGVPGVEACSLGVSKPPATRGILPITIKKGVS